MLKKRGVLIALTVILLLVWLMIGGAGGPTFGKISSVSKTSQADFLPASAESTQVQTLQNKFRAGKAIPAIVIVESDGTFSQKDFATYKTLAETIGKQPQVQGDVIGPIPSEDARAVEYVVPIKSDVKLQKAVPNLRTVIQRGVPPHATAYVTGPAGLNADLITAFGGIDGVLLIVALIAVLVILLLVYRSVLLPVLVLLNAMFALCAAILVVYLLAKAGLIELNGQSQGILSILVIGAATDYSLLFVSRYREALATASSKWEAVIQGLKRSFEPIVASAGTVILALLCLLFSDLNSNRSLGPIAATGILFALLATLTFLPALLVIFGRAAFWPSKIHTQASTVRIRTGKEELGGVWRRVGGLLDRRPRAVWIVTIVVLGLGALGLLQLKANGIPQTALVLTKSNAADGQKAIARHFPAGSGAPVLISVPQSKVGDVESVVEADLDFTNLMAYTDDGLTPELTLAKIVDGRVLLTAILLPDPYSDAANTAIKNLRETLQTNDTEALVGGTTALALDTTTTATADLFKIVPIVLFVILVILALLLRALIAPLVLILTVVLSFAATLGVSALVFNHFFNFPGADASVPLFGFVFLVALGVDYNIFLATRIREEALKIGTRSAILHSLGKTGGVITSAGIVLAATFAALCVIPILFLVQIAFIVAFGVLLDTIIVRSLLVPALFSELGPKIWWPSKRPSR